MQQVTPKFGFLPILLTSSYFLMAPIRASCEYSAPRAMQVRHRRTTTGPAARYPTTTSLGLTIGECEAVANRSHGVPGVD